MLCEKQRQEGLNQLFACVCQQAVQHTATPQHVTIFDRSRSECTFTSQWIHQEEEWSASVPKLQQTD